MSPSNPEQNHRIREEVLAAGGRYDHLDIPERGRWWHVPMGLLRGAVRIRSLCRRHPYAGFLVRSSIPALILRLSRQIRNDRLFLFDADGFMQEERAEFASWRRGGPAYQILNHIEQWAVRRAHVVMVRTRRAAESIIRKNRYHLKSSSITLVANGRDEEKFRPEKERNNCPPRIIFTGSVGPQYCVGEMFRFFLKVKKRLPSAEFHFCTPQIDEARREAQKYLRDQNGLKIEFLRGEQLCRALRESDLGLALRIKSFSMEAVSPIKCGEYLLSGVPILGLQGTGDLDDTLAPTACCRFLSGLEEADLEQAAEWFCQEIMPRRGIHQKQCRELGLKHYGFKHAVQSYGQALSLAERNFAGLKIPRPVKKKRVVYLSHDGMMEPLGQSQVVSYLEGLSDRWAVEIFSFEKPADLKNRPRFLRMQSQLASRGIVWIPRAYHNRPKNIAQVIGLLGLIVRLWYRFPFDPPEIVHARSYPAMLVAWLAFPGGRTKKIFDMRGFWADEKVSAGTWKKNQLLYILTKKVEALFLRGSEKVICLTRAAAEILGQMGVSKPRLAVIPTCVNLQRFHPPNDRTERTKPILCFSGNLAGWYCQEEMFKAAEVFLNQITGSKLLVLGQGGLSGLPKTVSLNAWNPEQWMQQSVYFDDMPTWIQRASLGLFFSRPAFSELGRSPTKMAEFLACGVPVITNQGIGDASKIISEEGVGLVLDEPKAALFAEKLQMIRDLLADQDIPARCRRVAEKYFDLAEGIRTYDAVYRQLTREPEMDRISPFVPLELLRGSDKPTTIAS